MWPLLLLLLWRTSGTSSCTQNRSSPFSPALQLHQYETLLCSMIWVLHWLFVSDVESFSLELHSYFDQDKRAAFAACAKDASTMLYRHSVAWPATTSYPGCWRWVVHDIVIYCDIWHTLTYPTLLHFLTRPQNVLETVMSRPFGSVWTASIGNLLWSLVHSFRDWCRTWVCRAHAKHIEEVICCP